MRLMTTEAVVIFQTKKLFARKKIFLKTRYLFETIVPQMLDFLLEDGVNYSATTTAATTTTEQQQNCFLNGEQN